MKEQLTIIDQLFVETNDKIEKNLLDNNTNQDEINQNFDLIEKSLEDIKSHNSHNKLKTYLNNMRAAYLKSIEDLRIDVENSPKSKNCVPIEAYSSPTIESKKHTSQYITYIKDMINHGDTNTEKSIWYNKLAWFYHQKAKTQDGTHHLRNMANWLNAKSYYKQSLDSDSRNFRSASGYAKCLVHLSKYDVAVKFLETYKKDDDRKNIQDYYLVKAMAYRMQFQYGKAKNEIRKAVELNPTSVDVTKEQELLEKIENNKKEAKLEEYAVIPENHCHLETFEKRQEQVKPYRVLSIDGGGIRGIIPAVWVCEIEKRTHRPISHSFNLLSGTSTGGIISAGLSIPKNDDGYTPQYRAYEILDIYLKKGKYIFSSNYFSKMTSIFRSAYSDSGRKGLLVDYFGQKRLSQSLTELVIPAAYEEGLYTTYLFNRFDSFEDPNQNDTFVDALMATSAAPTYFPSHKIENKGLFNDGGVHVNNPSSVACQEALRYGIEKDNLFLLSLGTGAFIPEALNPSSLRGMVYWAKHLQDVALQAQVGNTDIAMFNALPGRYTRWQSWFENEITLDDYGTSNIDFLLESANQHIEELDYSEGNSFNKLVESILNDYEY
jgi:tetratricopeptide (TPR) repeat protein